MSTANAISDPAQHRPSVFISGSISIRALPIPVTDRLDVILDRKLPVLIGDALGVDAAAQHHLAMWGARDVTIFCSSPAPRHSAADWPIRRIRTDCPPGTRAWHSAKDREMSQLEHVSS
jgi:hypothetical protein